MVKIGDTNEDVSIITNGEGILKLETGGGNKDIEIKPNGTGKTIIYSDHVATTFNNDGTVNVPSSGARFSKNGSKVDLLISGKLTVDGLIDPTGLILDDGSGETLDATKCCITWDGNTGDGANLQVQFPDGSGGSTTKYIPFSGSANQGSGGGSGGGGGGSVDKANTIKVEDIGSSTAELEVVFCNSAGSGNNLYESLKSDQDKLHYVPNSGTLKSTIFEGKATALNLNTAGLVQVAVDGSISVDTSSYALSSNIPTNNNQLANGASYITAAGAGVTNVTKSGDDLTFTKADSSTVTFGRENIEDVLAGMLTSNASNNAHKNVTVSYTDSNDSTQGVLALEANGDLFLKSDGPRIIKVDEGSGGNDGAGNNLTLEAGAAKGNNGNNGYNGGNIELVPGTATNATAGGTDGTAGNVVIKGSRTIATSGGDLTIAPSDSVVTLQGNSAAPIITTGSNSQDLKIQPKSGITEFAAASGTDAARITSAAGKDLTIQPAVITSNSVSNLKVESTTGNCRLSLEASSTSTSGDYWTEIEMIAQNNQNNFITSNKTLKFIDEPASSYNSYMDIEMNSTDHQNSKIKAYVPLQFSETKNGTITAEKRAVTDGSELGNPIIIRQGGVETTNIVGSPDLAGGNVIIYSGRTESKSGTSNQTQNDITSDCKFVIGSVDGLINNKTVEILDEKKHTLTIKKAGKGFTAEAVYKLSIGLDVDGVEITDVDTLKGGYVDISVTIDEEGTNTGYSDEETWQVAKKLVDAVNNNRYLQSIGFEAGFKSDGITSNSDTKVYFYSRRDGLTLEYKNGSGGNAWAVNNNGGATDAGWMEWTDSGGTATLKPTKHLKITPSDIDFEAQSNGDGNNFTIKTQSGVGNDGGTGNNDGYDGGDLILEPGTGSNANGGTNGTNGSVVIKNGFKVESSIGGSMPTSGNNNVLVVDSNGIVTVDSISSASGTYGDSNVETLLQGNLSTATTNNDFNIKMTDRGNNTDAKKLKITAQGFDGSANHEGNGGDLELSGGLAKGSNKTDGVVNITSGFKLGNSIFTTSDGPLEVTSGVVGVGSYPITSVDEHLDDLGDGTSPFTIKMINNTNGDGANFTIQGQQGKAGTNSHGGDLRLIGGSQTGTGKKQGNVIVSGDNVDWISDSNGNQFKLLGGDGYAEIILQPNDTNPAGQNHFNFISYKTRQLKFAAEATSSKIALTMDHTSPGQLTLGEGSDGSVVARIRSATGKDLELTTEGSNNIDLQPGSSNIFLGTTNATTNFTMKLPDHSTGEGKNLTIAAQKAGGTNDANGGNLVLSGGAKAANGSDGIVQISSDIRLGDGDNSDFTMKMTDSDSAANAKTLKIVGQKADTTGAFSGGNIEITSGEANNTSSSGTAKYGGHIILSAVGGTGPDIYRGMIHMKNYPIIQDYAIWRGTYSQLDEKTIDSSTQKYIKVTDLLAGFIRIEVGGSDRVVYVPTAAEINVTFPTSTANTVGQRITGTGFRCTICALGGSGTPLRKISFRRPPSSNLIFYDNTQANALGSSDDLELTEGNSMDILVQKNTSAGEWSITRLN